MKITISPQYEYLRPYLSDITTHFDNGREIHSGRNHIRVISPDGHLQLNVKRYAIPHWPNRLIYSCFRRPKGLRAFTYPEHLIAAGIDTPAPVAYIEERTAGLIGYTYFVSLQSELPERLYELGNARMDRPEHISLARDLARFAARIHEARLSLRATCSTKLSPTVHTASHSSTSTACVSAKSTSREDAPTSHGYGDNRSCSNCWLRNTLPHAASTPKNASDS